MFDAAREAAAGSALAVCVGSCHDKGGLAAMKKVIPLKKQSKKAQKKYYAEQRGSWNGLSPVTRVVPSKKVYDRKKIRLTKIEAEEE